MRIELPEEEQANPLAHLADHYSPEIVNAGFAFAMAVYQHSSLTARECEAARTRTAEINGCQICQKLRIVRDLPGYFEAAGCNATDADTVASRGPAPDEDFYRNVSNWRDYPDYSERERLAIAYAEGLGLDPKAIATDEEFWTRIKAAFTDNEIVDLTYALSSWIGLGRATHALGLDSACAWMPTADTNS